MAAGMLARAGALATAHGVPLSPGLRQLVVASPPEAMRTVLRRLHDAGGAECYLLDRGLDAAVPALLRERLLTEG
ncbi:hypothetical protein HNR16_002544 [Pseudoclavibacter chungangensis]|uniref:hypothetical protein n=1 Tax=Pseudoclavibacter chungangensis TaxID=587635 RepID=UPI0015CE8A08|nr:hypothetical protein [Pseudoclavibacter chungangensis]NYJ67756.1 hypothetical protein [Pseudoclavibacter chungangensis]